MEEQTGEGELKMSLFLKTSTSWLYLSSASRVFDTPVHSHRDRYTANHYQRVIMMVIFLLNSDFYYCDKSYMSSFHVLKCNFVFYHCGGFSADRVRTLR